MVNADICVPERENKKSRTEVRMEKTTVVRKHRPPCITKMLYLGGGGGHLPGRPLPSPSLAVVRTLGNILFQQD